MTPEELRKMAQNYSDRADEMSERYGTGVTPSWVSADLAMMRAIADRCLKEARELEEKE